MAHISVVIPVYRAEGCLAELYRRLCQSLETVTSDFELILVEDCGGDGSWQQIEALCQQDSRVKGIQFSRNFGQHTGITAGIDHCDGDWLVVMDCDLQDRPEEIPRLYHKAQEGYDIVLALRKYRQDGLIKKLTSRIFFRVFNYFTEMNYNGDVGNFRMISRRVVDAIRPMREHLRFFGGLVDAVGFSITSVDVHHDRRFEGASSYSFVKLVRLAVHFIIAYSNKPLRLAAQLGFLISLLSFGLGSFFLVRAWLWKIPVSGWSSLIVSLYFLGGLIIALLGINGIYLGKTFNEVKRRPLYVIAERQNLDAIKHDGNRPFPQG